MSAPKPSGKRAPFEVVICGKTMPNEDGGVLTQVGVLFRYSVIPFTPRFDAVRHVSHPLLLWSWYAFL